MTELAVTYFQRSDASELTGPTGNAGTSRHLVASRTAGAETVALPSGNMNANLFCQQNFFTPAGDPGVDGDTGSFEVKVRCTAASAGGTVQFRAFLYRVNSSGTIQNGPVESAQGQQSAVADTTRTFTWSSPSLGTWGATDRLLVGVSMQNTSGSMNQSASISVDTSDDTIDTPFVAGEPTLVEVDAVGETTTGGEAAFRLTRGHLVELVVS